MKSVCEGGGVVPHTSRTLLCLLIYFYLFFLNQDIYIDCFALRKRYTTDGLQIEKDLRINQTKDISSNKKQKSG